MRNTLKRALALSARLKQAQPPLIKALVYMSLAQSAWKKAWAGVDAKDERKFKAGLAEFLGHLSTATKEAGMEQLSRALQQAQKQAR